MNKSLVYLATKYSQWLQELGQPEDGQGITEYAMILSFVVIMLVILLYYFGAQVELTYQDILNQLPF
jgi:Flp pilus assembly pilin Flp